MKIFLFLFLILVTFDSANAASRRRALMFSKPTSAGAAETFPPATNDIVFWAKADAGVTNLSDVTPPSNADVVKGWADSSGNGSPSLNPGAGPTYRTSVQNGKPVIRFTSASSQYLTNIFGSVLSGEDISMTISIMFSVVATNVTGYPAVLRNGADTDSAWWFGHFNSGQWITFKRDNGAGPTGQLLGNGINAGTFYNSTWVFNGTTVTHYTNNVQCSSGTIDVGTTTIDSMWLGRIGSTYFNGDVGEYIIWDKVLDSTELTECDDYYKTRWAHHP